MTPFLILKWRRVQDHKTLDSEANSEMVQRQELVDVDVSSFEFMESLCWTDEPINHFFGRFFEKNVHIYVW
jgi:hypothetical protein